MTPDPSAAPSFDRRGFLGAGTALALAPRRARAARPRPAGPVLVGSANALAGMRQAWPALVAGGDPLDAAIDVVKVVEADPNDSSVGLGGLPNEAGVVQLDAACMHGPTHNSGAVGCIENILHPSEVARLVMERTDHCLIVGRGAYEFARMHGHPHTELLTEASRRRWLEWRESLSETDDRLPARPEEQDEEQGRAASPSPRARVAGLQERRRRMRERSWGTIHCSALSAAGELACTTTTSGLAWKIPGRVGDSPIVGAGLYCDQEAGSAGATGRGEAAILANGSFAIVELMRQGKSPLDAGLEVLRRVARQAQRASSWQPALTEEDGRPSFGLKFYVLGLDGSWAGVSLRGGGKFSVADSAGGPRHEDLVPLFS